MKGGGEERRGKWLSALLQGSMKNEKQKKYSFYLRTFLTFFRALFFGTNSSGQLFAPEGRDKRDKYSHE